MRPILYAAAALLPLTSAHAQHHARPEAGQAPASVGQVSFANSGAPQAQAAFLRGLAQLHNFEYPSAAEAFRQAQAADPGFALAYWGEAMTHNHPVWMEQDEAAARAALAKLAPTREARLAKAKTPRERAYLEAVEALYGEGSKEERDRAYSGRMAALHGAYPQDVDGRAFYALSLLGLAHKGRDVPLYMKAAALLEEAFPANQRHPGVLHYLIHSYDDSAHAPLGLRAARLYGKVAPDAGHALHMTSHIFNALGMWAESETANVQAVATVNRQRAAAGRPLARCGHYNEWLVYARLQQGKPEAEAGVAACREAALAAPAPGGSAEESRIGTGSGIWSYSDMAVRRLIETGKWDPAPALREGRDLSAAFNFAYGDLLAAGQDASRLRTARARLEAAARAIEEARSKEGPGYALAPAREKVILGQAAGLERLASGDAEGGLALLREAAAREAAIPAEFGPPLVEKPTQELIGEALLRLGRKAEAAEAFRAALVATPGRRLSVNGLEAAGR
jgi:tetratricopeptide (TPR) repeat protein